MHWYKATKNDCYSNALTTITCGPKNCPGEVFLSIKHAALNAPYIKTDTRAHTTTQNTCILSLKHCRRRYCRYAWLTLKKYLHVLYICWL